MGAPDRPELTRSSKVNKSGEEKVCRGGIKERGNEEGRSTCHALVNGQRGGAEIWVCKKNREREGGREGRKKGRADSYFSTVKS